MLKTQILGNVGNDATIGNHGGKSVINFSVAHTETYEKDGVKNQKTTWLNCSKWCDDGKTGIAQYIKKGDQIYVSGTPQISVYKNERGETLPEFKLRVEEITLLPNGK